MEVVALSNFGKELSWEVDEVLSKQIVEKTKGVILATKQLQASVQAYKSEPNHVAVVKEMKSVMFATNALYTLISEIAESGNHDVSIPTLNKLIENFKNALSALGVFLKDNMNREQSKENQQHQQQPLQQHQTKENLKKKPSFTKENVNSLSNENLLEKLEYNAKSLQQQQPQSPPQPSSPQQQQHEQSSPQSSPPQTQRIEKTEIEKKEMRKIKKRELKMIKKKIEDKKKIDEEKKRN